jgi:hypothetical protein
MAGGASLEEALMLAPLGLATGGVAHRHHYADGGRDEGGGSAGLGAAITPEQLKALSTDTGDDTAEGASDILAGVKPAQGAKGADAANQYMDYLVNKKGLDTHVAAGMLGNAYHESSGLQPNIVGDSGDSIGLFQFHRKGEQPAFRQWAAQNNRDISDPYAQLDFTTERLQGPYSQTFQAMQNAKDPASAAALFMHGYERPKEGPTEALSQRMAYANAIANGEQLPSFRAYAGAQPGAGDAAASQAIQRNLAGQQGLGAAAEQPGFFDRNKNIILPVLQGLGAMAGSKSRYLGSAVLEGLGAGAKAYGDTEAQQAGIEGAKAATFETAQRGANLSFLNNGMIVRMPDGSLMLTVDAIKKGLIPSGGKLSALAQDSAAKRYLQSLEPNAPPAVQYNAEPQPAPPDVGPKPVNAQEDPSMTERGIWGDQSRSLAQKDSRLTMGMGPGSSGAKAVSDSYQTSTAAGALQASQNASVVNDLARNTSRLVNLQGADVAGAGADFRARLSNTANTILRGIGYTGEPVSELDNADALNRKLSTFLGSSAAHSSGQDSLQGLQTILSAFPKTNMPPDTQARLAAQIMLTHQKALDRDAHREVYGDVSNGSYALAGQAFDKDTAARYQREERLLSAAILKDPQAMEKLTSGTKSPEVVDQYFRQLSQKTGVPYSPNMHRYFAGGL